MPLRHACFVSYFHDDSELVKEFVTQLKDSLNTYLGVYLPQKVYDDSRLSPGDFFNNVLPQEICESICMVVVYAPRYLRQDYCIRELTAMEQIEKARLQVLGPNAHRKGFIIPVVFRGDMKNLPPRLGAERHCEDFTKFSIATGSVKMKYDKDFIDKVDSICRAIDDLFARCEPHAADFDAALPCEGFPMPPVHRPPNPEGAPVAPGQPFPGRTLP